MTIAANRPAEGSPLQGVASHRGAPDPRRKISLMGVTGAGHLPNHHSAAAIAWRRRAAARIERHVIMDPDQLFTRLERQVITLAATNQGECEGLARHGPRQGWLARMLRRLVPVAMAKPLANERLEALRKLACACFGSAGRPDRQAVDTALAAGIDSEQVAGLNGLARRHFPGHRSSAP